MSFARLDLKSRTENTCFCAQNFQHCIASRPQNRRQQNSFPWRVVDIVKDSNQFALSGGYHLWLQTAFPLMEIKTLIEIMNSLFRRSK